MARNGHQLSLKSMASWHVLDAAFWQPLRLNTLIASAAAHEVACRFLLGLQFDADRSGTFQGQLANPIQPFKTLDYLSEAAHSVTAERKIPHF